jgi:hypothetical protein
VPGNVGGAEAIVDVLDALGLSAPAAEGR